MGVRTHQWSVSDTLTPESVVISDDDVGWMVFRPRSLILASSVRLLTADLRWLVIVDSPSAIGCYYDEEMIERVKRVEFHFNWVGMDEYLSIQAILERGPETSVVMLFSDHSKCRRHDTMEPWNIFCLFKFFSRLQTAPASDPGKWALIPKIPAFF